MKLSVNGITKHYGSNVANNNISFEVNSGEVLTILGENGAGKTTLMRIIYGLEPADSGNICIDDKPVDIKSPRDSIKLGIGMVHQHFMLINNFTVAENMILAMKEEYGTLLDMNAINKRIDEFFKKYNFDIKPDSIVGKLPVGYKQRVEIMKALFKGAEVLVLDEPTAVLAPSEINELFEIIRQLCKEGKSVIFISHKLNEVMEISDRVLVLRRGETVGEVKASETNQKELVKLMIGRDLGALKKDVVSPDLKRRKVLDLDSVSVNTKHGCLVDNVSFAVWNHEIVGIAGVDGNGQKELVESITGLFHEYTGKISINDKDIARKSVKKIRGLGVSHVPEDRQLRGLILPFTLTENYIMNNFCKKPISRFGFINNKKAAAYAEKLNEDYHVASNGVNTPVSTLSGGNQQKIVVAREINTPHDLLVAVKPTRGVDVGAIEYIHSYILKERENDKAVLLVSSELDEILTLSDRIIVMCGGAITGMVWADEVTKEDLGEMMTGAKEQFTALTPNKVWRQGNE